MKQNRLKELRRSRKISQQRLAVELNVTQASISLYESGANIPTDILIALSKYFGASSDYILGLSERPSGVSEEEYNLLKIYRSLEPRCRKAVDTIAEFMSRI